MCFCLGTDNDKQLKGMIMDKLIAFHGQQAEKDAAVAMMRAHRTADEIAQKTYGQTLPGGKRVACLVGCATGGSHHELFPSKFGIPEPLAYLADAIFEELPFDQAVELPVEFFERIPVGADLSLVWPHFAVWLLADEQHGVRQFALPDGQAAIDTIAALYRRLLDGEEVPAIEFRAAAEAARVAHAADAAYAAAYAAEAAYAAAYAAEVADAAAYAAYAAARVAAYAAASTEFWQAARDELLTLLANAPVVELA
jgi:hypothetical protein